MGGEAREASKGGEAEEVVYKATTQIVEVNTQILSKEILKTEKTPLGRGVCVKVEEGEVQERLANWIDVWLGGGVKGLLRSRRSTL